MDVDSYTKLFEVGSHYIGFLSTWVDILKQIAEKMEKDKSWLKDENDRGRVKYCLKLFMNWYKRFGTTNTNGYVKRAKFYLTYIKECVEKGDQAGPIPK